MLLVVVAVGRWTSTDAATQTTITTTTGPTTTVTTVTETTGPPETTTPTETTTEPATETTTLAACVNDTICYNGARCYYDDADDVDRCLCEPGYIGHDCAVGTHHRRAIDKCPLDILLASQTARKALSPTTDKWVITRWRTARVPKVIIPVTH